MTRAYATKVLLLEQAEVNVLQKLLAVQMERLEKMQYKTMESEFMEEVIYNLQLALD